MDILSTKLAKSIVERTMNVVSYNINIMNELGVIIASGDKERTGTIHEGAIIALQRKSEFNVSESQSKKLNGVYAGTNLVIEFQDKVVGVIGITGKPKEVLRYGKLIKMTAEMMIEQENVLRELEWNNRMKEEMMLALIYNKQDSFLLLEEYVKKFKIPYNHAMVIFIIEVNVKDNSESMDQNMSNEMISLLEGTFKESVAAVINSKSIVLLHKCLSSNNKIKNYTERLNEVSEKIYNKAGIKVKISTGKIYDKLDNMYKSFDTAKDTLLFGKKIYPNENIYSFDSLKCEMLFSQKNEKWKINELEETYQLLSLNDKSGVLRETLKVLIDEDGELNNVSSRLFIHRNTLSYRLNKIYKLTNKNPRSYTELFWLYSAIINFQQL
ncbi:helix-turn-helix domain-containing protein [Clostridium estertheticum]|uniref:sugar diacid recognition domain-containing protein n=1 Tax=Clostridium estertheticum TaxID=238834 RepID=UPI001C6EAA85|nr:sugar diacid recognition domain-containing protein [Clostridium estertheticum]MBW9171570.1 helix-turn-helix domain-containing protein [Clostridium estertheticum]WLC77067.1 helix-turn-helix domain-containing protein [Clostridium estertheticum]